MSTVIYPELLTYLEPLRLIEPRVLSLKLDPYPSHSFGEIYCTDPQPQTNSHFEDDNTVNTTTASAAVNNVKEAEMGGWSFLQSLSNPSDTTKINGEEDKFVYVHPLVKRSDSASNLSLKSLEMCTESLGSETGSDCTVTSSRNVISLLSSDTPKSNYSTKQSSASHAISSYKRPKHQGNFPPPLSSISGPGAVRVKPHREGGRLVLEALAVPCCSTYFHVERGNGRLRLQLLKDCSVNSESLEVVDEEEGEVEVYNDDDEEETEELMCLDEEMEGNNVNVGGEMGSGKFARPSRCKESRSDSKRLLNWEPFSGGYLIAHY